MTMAMRTESRPGSVSGRTPAALAVTPATMPMRPYWTMTAVPVPRTFPASREVGRTQARRISTILLDFSSTTPMATIWPPAMMTAMSRTSIVRSMP